MLYWWRRLGSRDSRREEVHTGPSRVEDPPFLLLILLLHPSKAAPQRLAAKGYIQTRIKKHRDRWVGEKKLLLLRTCADEDQDMRRDVIIYEIGVL
ncbi:hypothetical protein K432DRAFT_381030 [Lepidopterella palustris CBS 459.81]|uniref:Uncharacterized protein n=1 Tax=Lepidopterella palustris CBS 459.81 TaxID=1314670 RepID=A0A8E2ED23_9PEZI|nr:hypothetical protein K432DRAFT_381030 [Lepidopterella palustris CBS 459.81]